MTDEDPQFGFGSIVTVELYGHELDGEIVGTGPDNRDLDDDQYIVAFGWESDQYDEISSQEIIRPSQVVDVVEG